MEDKHTPGPWLIATSNSWRRIVSHRGDVVCGPCNQPDGHPDLTFPNGGAEGPDARLIAAAPDLLAALNECLHGHPDVRLTPDAIVMARAAIAKATGSGP